MMATYTDDFNRADESPVWTAVVNGGCKIVSNQVNAVNVGFCVSALIGEPFADDQSADIALPTYALSDNPGVALRVDASGNGYAMLWNSSEIIAYRMDLGVRTQIGYAPTTITPGVDTVGLAITGSTLTARKNGSPVAWAEAWDGVDATHTSGVTGIAYDYGNANATRIDDFTAEGYTAGPTVTQTDTTPEDGVQQTINTSGLTGPVTAASVGGKSILSLLSGTDPTVAITYTLDIFNGTTTGTSPRFKEPTNLSITATGGAPTQSLTWQPATGDDVITLAGTLNKDPLELLAKVDAALGVTTVVTDQIYYATADSTSITATGVLTSDATSIQMWLLQGGDADNAATSTPFVVTFGPGGNIVIRTKYRRFPWQSHNKLL